MAIPLKIAHILVNKPIPNSKTSLLRDVKPATKAVAWIMKKPSSKKDWTLLDLDSSRH